jgi:hypothetical protein
MLKIVLYSILALLGLFICIGIYFGILFFWFTIKLIALAVIIGYGLYWLGKFKSRRK